VIWLDKGKIALVGSTSEVVAKYLSSNSSDSGLIEFPEGAANSDVDEFKLFAVRIQGPRGEVSSNLDARYPFSISIDYRIMKPLDSCRVGFVLATADGTVVFDSYDSDEEDAGNQGLQGRRAPGDYRVRCEIPGELLLHGHYIISVCAGVPRIKNLIYLENLLALTIEETRIVSETQAPPVGVIRPKLRWERLES
jgi:hypothetical protein